MLNETNKNMDDNTYYQNQCSVLILSCDKNISVLRIFLDSFNKHWPTCFMPVYIGMEKCNIDFPNATTLYSEEVLWAARVKGYLNEIKTTQVLIILDDFILEERVDDDLIRKSLYYMMNKSEIANMTFSHVADSKNEVSNYKGFYKRHQRGKYLLNMQVGIWKKDILYSLLKDKESPWQTELYGSIRARKFKKHSFYCIVNDTLKPIKYNNGWLIVRGAWNGNEIIRLNLMNYGTEIFDGKNILYDGFGKISLISRIFRRLGILIRQFFSLLNIYF